MILQKIWRRFCSNICHRTRFYSKGMISFATRNWLLEKAAQRMSFSAGLDRNIESRKFQKLVSKLILRCEGKDYMLFMTVWKERLIVKQETHLGGRKQSLMILGMTAIWQSELNLIPQFTTYFNNITAKCAMMEYHPVRHSSKNVTTILSLSKFDSIMTIKAYFKSELGKTSAESQEEIIMEQNNIMQLFLMLLSIHCRSNTVETETRQ